ncbi:hypothetical protein BDZ45DRAFT_49325 [Acephala macrosclerotiorum]|nr:hypothetical protein BDZ45DRAFT_49325 [Acephala macrosclerotiorum]
MDTSMEHGGKRLRRERDASRRKLSDIFPFSFVRYKKWLACLCLPYLLVFPLIALPPILIIYNNGCDEVIARRHHSSIEFIPSLVHPARKNLSRISSRIHLPSYSSSKYLSNIDSLSSQPASLLSGSKIQLQK